MKETKTIKVVTEFEVPEDFNDFESLGMFVSGTMDNADYGLLQEECSGAEIGISYVFNG